jgi:hypothetical protein
MCYIKKIDDSISSQDKFTAQKLPDSAFMWTAPTLFVTQMAKQVFAGLGLKTRDLMKTNVTLNNKPV